MNISDLIASCAIVVAVCALWATIWQAAIARRHIRLSVLPSLYANVRFAHESDGIVFELKLRNNGIGPAIITASYLLKQDVGRYKVPNGKLAVIEHFREIFNGLDGSGHSAFFPPPGCVVSTNEEIIIYRTKLWRVGSKGVLREIDRFGGICFDIHYESLYKEQFILDFRYGGHMDRDSAPAADDEA
jgi:hypothetical protein